MAHQSQPEEPPATEGHVVEQRPASTADSENPKDSNDIAQPPNRLLQFKGLRIFYFLLDTLRLVPRCTAPAFVRAVGSFGNPFIPFSITRILIRYTYPLVAGLYRTLYVRQDQPRFLERSIYFSRKVLDNVANNDPSLRHYQQRLGISLYDRFTHFHDPKDLRAAIDLQRNALQYTPSSHSTWNWHARGLDESLREEHQVIGTTRSIEDAIALETQAISQFKEDKSILSWWQHSLAMSYRLRFNWKGQATDLDAASHWIELSILNTPESDATALLSRRSTRATILEDRFTIHSTLPDLDAAITELKLLIDMSHTPELLAHRLMTLGHCLHNRFNFQGEKEDLDAAINYVRKATTTVPMHHSTLPIAQHNLSVIIQVRYNLLNHREDLEEALRNSRQAAEGIPRIDKRRCYVYHQLGNTLLLQYAEDDNLQNLELALKWFNDALDAANTMDRHYFKVQVGMAEVHHALFLKQGNMEDIELAIMWIKNAMATPALKDKELADLYYTLGILHRGRWSRFRLVEDLDPAVDAYLFAVQKTPASHPELHKRQAALGLAYSGRYRRLGDRNDQAQALEWLHRAVDTAPIGHFSLLENLALISHEYSARYNWRREEEDLEKAITYALRAVDLLPKDSYERHPTLFSALASAYSQKADLNHDDESVQNAYSWFRKYMETNPSPNHAWNLANEWARFAKRTRHKEECLAAYVRVMRILPELLWVGSKITVRHEALKRYNITSTTSEAIEACIRFDVPERAVEFVEQGLAITFQQLLDLREDHADLQRAHPELEGELKRLSNTLETISDDVQPGSQEAGGSRSSEAKRRRAADEREKLLDRIRELPGFENFLLPKPFEELREAANEGPVVILCANRTWSHALIVMQSGVVTATLGSVIALRDQLDKIRSSLMRLGIGSRREYQDYELEHSKSAEIVGEEDILRKGRIAYRNKETKGAPLNEVLDWLWAVIVSPVLKKLEENGITGGRIWWCPTGLFTYLPVHAAGPPNAFIHSYTPTLGGLIRARKAHAKGSNEPRLTAIGLSEFEKTTISRLPSVLEELNRVHSVAQAAGMKDKSVVFLVNQEATLENVTQALAKSSWLHLACHGQQNTKDPLKSGLVLYDEKLELEKLMEMPLPDAQFVFLSACETAMGDKDMTNEALHLAGGMLFAGFKGAVGTLWSINDSDGPFVAENVYRQLFASGKKPDAKDAALALHNAIQSLRRSGVPAHRWVPFIHLGI